MQTEGVGGWYHLLMNHIVLKLIESLSFRGLWVFELQVETLPSSLPRPDVIHLPVA